MNNLSFRVVLAVIGLFAFVALLVTTVMLVDQGQGGLAALTGTGAVGLGTSGLFGLLQGLGK